MLAVPAAPGVGVVLVLGVVLLLLLLLLPLELVPYLRAEKGNREVVPPGDVLGLVVGGLGDR